MILANSSQTSTLWSQLNTQSTHSICCFCVLVCSPGVLEKPLEKKAGRKFAPPTAKKLIYFIDDLNMPEVDVYGTVQPHTLIRQHLDYNHWWGVISHKGINLEILVSL